VWVEFARAMAPMMAMPAELLAQLVDPAKDQKLRVLDIAAGHGLYGIAFAKQNPQIEVTAVDWPNVLELANRMRKALELPDASRRTPAAHLMWIMELITTSCC